MPLKKIVRTVAPAVEEAEEVEVVEEAEEQDPELPVDPEDAEEVEEEVEVVEEEEEEEAPAPVAKPKLVAKAPVAVAKPAVKAPVAVAKPVAKAPVAVAKPVAKAPVAKAPVAVAKPVAKAPVAKAAPAKPARPALINIGGKKAAPATSFQLTVGDQTFTVPGEAPAEMGARISRESVESAIHEVLTSRGIFPANTTKRATAEALKAIEDTLLSVVSVWNFKFMGGMFKLRQIGERYYPPIDETRLGSYMPAHYRIKLDINASGVKAEQGILNAKGEFVPAEAPKKAVKK
jgi:hypothetical protein